jgi:hypothetical protein
MKGLRDDSTVTDFLLPIELLKAAKRPTYILEELDLFLDNCYSDAISAIETVSLNNNTSTIYLFRYFKNFSLFQAWLSPQKATA